MRLVFVLIPLKFILLPYCFSCCCSVCYFQRFYSLLNLLWYEYPSIRSGLCLVSRGFMNMDYYRLCFRIDIRIYRSKKNVAHVQSIWLKRNVFYLKLWLPCCFLCMCWFVGCLLNLLAITNAHACMAARVHAGICRKWLKSVKWHVDAILKI